METIRYKRSFSDGEFVEVEIVVDDPNCTTIKILSNFFGEKRLEIQLFNMGEDFAKGLLEFLLYPFSQLHSIPVMVYVFLTDRMKESLYCELGKEGVSVFERCYSNVKPLYLNVLNVKITKKIKRLMRGKSENIEECVGTNGFEYFLEDVPDSFEEDLVDTLKKENPNFIEIKKNIEDLSDKVKTTLSASRDNSLIFKMEMLLQREYQSSFIEDMVISLIIDHYMEVNNMK